MSEATSLLCAKSVPLADVERELSTQLNSLQVDKKEVVQLVRMSNLVIYCNTVEIAQRIATQVPDVVAVHPARVILLIGDNGGADSAIAASVRVEARHLSGHQQACSEEVVLSAPAGLADRLPFAVRSLTIGDLPINLWWASPQPPPLAGSLLYELAEPAQQIMYDSLGWPDPARGVAATATWLETVERFRDADRWRVASDLNWRRLKFWRRLVRQALEPIENATIVEVTISHGPHAVVQAWELLSWLAVRLGWTVHGGKVDLGHEMTWHFHAPHGDVCFRIKRLEQGPPEIKCLRIRCALEGTPVTLDLISEGEGKLVQRVEGRAVEPRTIMLPEVSPAEMIGKQLSDRERDPVFRQSMQVAQVMAKSLLG